MLISMILLMLGAITIFISLILPPHVTNIQQLFVLIVGLGFIIAGIAGAFE